jgi:hypothetical protein
VGFALLATLGVVALALVFLAIGKLYPGTGADVLDWRPTRSHEEEARLELEDIDQMLEAQNERRRRSGREPLTEDAIRAQVDADRRERADHAERYRATRPPESPEQ